MATNDNLDEDDELDLPLPKCPVCGGTGFEPEGWDCDFCNGTGELEI